MSVPHAIRLARYAAEILATTTAAVSALIILGPPHALADCVAECRQDATPASSSLLPNLLGRGLSQVVPRSAIAPKALARAIVPPDQFDAFDQVITHESSWNTFAVNPVSGAYGLGQALPAQRMFTHGLDWAYNPVTQIHWAYDYMCRRYGSPDGAWAFWQRHHWY